MLRLTLVRHAKTEPGRSGQEDWERVLAARGERDAPEMGRRLKGRGLKPDSIVSSPAIRAISTATIIAGELGIAADAIVQDERLYLATPNVLMQVVQELGGSARHLSRHLMVVAHNPGISEFAERLSAQGSLGSLPTCAVYTLEFDLPDWPSLDWSIGINAQLDYPKK